MRRILKGLMSILVVLSILGTMNHSISISQQAQHFSILDEMLPNDLPDRH